MKKVDEVRIDKYLWAIRIFKTRTLAAEACDSGKVKLNDSSVKASKKVKIGETYHIRLSADSTKIVEVIELLGSRVSAALVDQFYKDHTIIVERTPKKDNLYFRSNITRDKGKGRPTKKERRDLDEIEP
jgi:ribosome-associated heat shock protein Hsp15